MIQAENKAVVRAFVNRIVNFVDVRHGKIVRRWERATATRRCASLVRCHGRQAEYSHGVM
jgi:hypothetical protein